MNRQRAVQLWMWIAVGVCVVATAVIVTALLSDSDPTEAGCRESFSDALSGESEFPAECQDWLDGTVDQFEREADIVVACQDAVAQDHAERWTPELEFTSVDTEENSQGELVVSGNAESVNRLGELQKWTYTCTAVIDGERIDVVTVNTDRA